MSDYETNFLYEQGGADALRIAIVVRAIKDYKTALKKKDVCEIDSLEKFFRGSWYKLLCSIDGEYIIERIKKEVENEKNNKRNDSKGIKKIYTKRN